MAIWLDENSKIIVQGMTGSEGTKHTRRMVASGANVVGGVTPGKAGQEVDGIPVFNNVQDAMAATGANVTVVFVPPKFAKAAVIEAVDAQIPLAVVITEGIPVHDTAAFFQYAQNSTCVGIGGDPIIGTTHIDALQAFQDDPNTDAIVMIGEIGGDAEERAAAYIGKHITKPVVGYVAGFTAPEGKTMGHAGAIVSGSAGTAAAKQEALEAVGVKVGKTPSATAQLMREIMTKA